MPRTGRGRLLAGVALAVAAGTIAVGVVVGAADSTFDGSTATSKQRGSYQDQKHPGFSQKRHHRRRLRVLGESERCKNKRGEPTAHGMIRRTTPAEMLGPESSDIQTSVFWPARNGWMAGDCRSETFVWAGGGGVGGGSKTGRFVIRRYGFPRPRRFVIVDVPDSGPLKITNAPLGPEVVTSAQRAQLPFTSKRGITGTLNLSMDTITLSTGQVIQANPDF
jgi:hypothetical protein